jgi:hypothetical protein
MQNMKLMWNGHYPHHSTLPNEYPMIHGIQIPPRTVIQRFYQEFPEELESGDSAISTKLSNTFIIPSLKEVVFHLAMK